MSDLPIQREAMCGISALSEVQAAKRDGRRPPDQDEARPTEAREPACPASPLRRDDATRVQQVPSRRRLPTGLY